MAFQQNGTDLPSEDAPEGCRLVAHDTGDGWALGVEDAEHNLIATLAWPWKEESKTPAELRRYGFVII